MFSSAMLKYGLLAATLLPRVAAPHPPGRYVCGVVQDEMHNPLVGALVRTAGWWPQVCVTNAHGCFRLRLPGRRPVVRISLLGYQTLKFILPASGQVVLVPAHTGPGQASGTRRWLYRQCRALALQPE